MIHSFLLIGQSNMAGRGFIDEAIDVDKTNLKILRNGRWQKLFRPVNPDRRTSGVNLAESFAECYARDHGVEVGLIPCADGGTRIAQWAPGSLLFDNAIYQARLAMRTSTIAGILWHQGESDSREDRWITYGRDLEVMLTALRKELSLFDVPVLLGGLGAYLDSYTKSDHRQWPQINGELQKLAEKDPMIGYVSAEGLTPNPDNLHFSAVSLYEFGLRYYKEFQKLEDPNKVFGEKPNPDDALRTEIDAL